MVDGTPIYDIKPYIPYADCRPDAESGFAPDSGKRLDVEIPEEIEEKFPEEKRDALKTVLSLDPRPQYLEQGDREYGSISWVKEITLTGCHYVSPEGVYFTKITKHFDQDREIWGLTTNGTEFTTEEVVIKPNTTGVAID